MIVGAVRAAEAYSAALSVFGRRLAARCEVVDWSDGPLAWRFFRVREASLPDQGWKIHISASAVESASMLEAVLDTLVDSGASFKLPRRIGDVVYLNSGDAGAPLLGKIVTVYPRDAQHTGDLVRRLDSLWPVSRGP